MTSDDGNFANIRTSKKFKGRKGVPYHQLECHGQISLTNNLAKARTNFLKLLHQTGSFTQKSKSHIWALLTSSAQTWSYFIDDDEK